MSFDLLMEAFIEVVQLGSISRAADALYTSRQSISRQMTRLEDQIGVRLIRRGGGGIELTQEGHIFYNCVSKLCASYEEMLIEIRSMANAESCVKFGCPLGLTLEDRMNIWIDKASDSILRTDIRWEEHGPLDLTVGLLNGNLDFIVNYSDLLSEEGIESVIFCESQMLLIASNHYANIDCYSNAEDFSTANFYIMVPEGKNIIAAKENFRKDCMKMGIIPSDIIVMHNEHSVWMAVEMGSGVSIADQHSMIVKSPNIRVFPLQSVRQLRVAWCCKNTNPIVVHMAECFRKVKDIE